MWIPFGFGSAIDPAGFPTSHLGPFWAFDPFFAAPGPTLKEGAWAAQVIDPVPAGAPRPFLGSNCPDV